MDQSNNFVWHDGEILPLSAAKISPLDRAYLIGYGVFETMHAISGKVFALTRHWQRLCQSCEVLGLNKPSLSEFSRALEETLKANGFDQEGRQARVRCSVSPAVNGSTNALSMLVSAVTFQTFSAYEKLAIIPWPKNEHSPLTQVKCVSYAEQALAKQLVEDQAGEALWGNIAGDVCEGTTSNIFFVEHDTDTLLTPPLLAGCLPGVIRGLVIELAEKNGVSVQQRSIPIREFKQRVKEAFLTSSTRYVHAVSHVENQTLPECPGQLTRFMSDLMEKLILSNSDP